MATFTNQATLTYNGMSTTSNITTGELVEVLSATKTAVNKNYQQGDTVTYVVNIVNSGSTAYSGLSVADNLGSYTSGSATLIPLTYVDGSVQYYVNGALQAAPSVTTGSGITISGINVPANGNATLIYQAQVNEYAPLASGGTITNTATVSGSSISSITAQETIDVADDSNLTISKSMCPSSVTENGQLTYTFVIQNSGNTAVTAEDAAVVTDTFNPVLNNIAVTFNGTSWTSGTNYTYNTSTGEFATVSGQITVPAATYTQNPTTGAYSTNPGISTLTVTGTVS